MRKSAIRFILFVTVMMFLSHITIACSSNKESSSYTATESNTAANDNEVDFPTRTIEMVAGGGPGGGTDTFSRAIAKELTEILGVNVNVINKPGAAGGIASQEVAARPADGYTLMPTTTDTHINFVTGKTDNYLEEGIFYPLARIHFDPYVIVAKAGSEYTDINRLIEAAKAAPGSITIAGIGKDGIEEFTALRFAKAAGIELNYVPFDEAGKSRAALAGGHIDILIENIGEASTIVEAGEAELIMAFTQSKIEEYPDVPSSADLGWDLEIGMDRGWVVHGETPEPIIKKLEEAIKQAIETDSYKEYAKQQMLDKVDGWMDSAQYEQYMRDEMAAYKEIIEELGK